jgi:hypothetical protein
MTTDSECRLRLTSGDDFIRFEPTAHGFLEAHTFPDSHTEAGIIVESWTTGVVGPLYRDQ